MSMKHFIIDDIDDGSQVEIIKDWIFSKTVPTFSILALYFIFIFKIGPHFMEKRPPYVLKNTLIFYNATQIIYSLYLVSNFFRFLLFADVNDVGFKEGICYCVWCYLIAKMVDLLDTVFFVLRKKKNQITFLHVYHHSYMYFFSWYSINYSATLETMTTVGTMNSVVHVIMYFYYMVSAMGPQYQKYIWWKKYLTTIQLVQFCIMLVYIASVIKRLETNAISVWILSVNVVLFFVLFMDFYIKSYTKGAKTSSLKVQMNGSVTNGDAIKAQ